MIRSIWCVLLLLLPAVAAETVLEDPAGDVAVEVSNNPAPALPAGVKDEIDIRHVRILETPDAFEFRLGLESVHSPAGEADLVPDRLFYIDFAHEGKGFRIGAALLTQGAWNGFLYEEDPAQFTGYSYLQGLAVIEYPSDNEIGVIVERTLLADHLGALPALGRSLYDIQALTQWPYLVGAFTSITTQAVNGDPSGVYVQDWAGTDTNATYAVKIGLDQIGDARLRSDEPFRFSNGEATTFVYWITASNVGQQISTYTLSATGVPDGWAVQLPTGTFDLGPEQFIHLPVVLQTSFAHAHGSRETFQVEMQEQGGDGLGRINLGVVYPAIPQPAGHHNELRIWSHDQTSYLLQEAVAPAHQAAFGNDGTELAYMNAATTNDLDLGREVDFGYCGVGGGLLNVVLSQDLEDHHCLFIDLSPGLKMGLDFLIDETGLLEIAVDTPGPMMGAVVQGALLLREAKVVETQPGLERTEFEDTILAEIPASDAMDWSAGQEVSLELPVLPTAESDYIPYKKNLGLQLVLVVTSDSVSDGALLGMDLEPRLLPGGILTLPLVEYHDEVQDIPNLGGISWAAGDTDRTTNPGKTLTFQATLANSGGKDQYEVRLLGVNQDWAELVGPTTLTLAQNATQDYTVAVRVPADAFDGDFADFVLEASSLTDLSQRALVNFRATVDTGVDVPDEEHLVGEYKAPKKGSPGLPMLGLVAALVVAFRAKRS